MQKNHGITLVSLVITIIVLLILASVATYSGLNVVNSSKLTAFTTELKIMQTQVNAIYEEDSGKQIGEEITGDIQIQANKIFTESESGIVSQEGYRYWSQDLIKELGIEGVEQDFFVNLEKRSVVSYQGLKYEGKTYYTLNQVPNGLYNVEYIEPTEEKPTFEINSECIGINKWRITISNIQYDGYIDKWQVKYQLEGQDYWNTSKDLSFTVNKNGNYKIQVLNGNIVSGEQVKYLGYAQNGLMLYYDGINNTGEGDESHSFTTTTWRNLAGTEYNGNLQNFGEDSWNSDSLSFDGVDDWVSIGEMNYDNITMEAVILYEEEPSSAMDIIANVEGGGYAIEYSANNHWPYGSFYIQEDKAYTGVNGNTFEIGRKEFYSARYNGEIATFFNNGSEKEVIKKGTIGRPSNSTIMVLGANPSR